jgi:hypothetical protein
VAGVYNGVIVENTTPGQTDIVEHEETGKKEADGRDSDLNQIAAFLGHKTHTQDQPHDSLLLSGIQRESLSSVKR